MNSTEVLFCALLLTKDAESAPNGRSDLEKWSSAVLAEEKHALELEAAWKPRTEKRTAIDYFGPLERVFKRSWPYAELDTVGLAMQAWRRDGQYDGLTGELLHNYLARTPFAARTCKKTAPPKRWRSWAVIKIGRLLYDSAPALRKLLKLDVASEEAKPLHVVAAERAERISSLEAELEQQKAAAKLISDGWRKSRERLKNKNTAVTAARHDERSKAKEMIKQIKVSVHEERKEMKCQTARETAQTKTELETQYADKFETQRSGLNTARARAREAEREAAKAQRKLQRLEKRLEERAEREAEAEAEMCDADDEDDPTRRLPFELLPRRDELGRWQAEAPEIRVLKWAQEARGVAPSTVSANIADVLALIAPHLDIPMSCERQNRIIRGEVTLAGEAMAALKFAAAMRIMSFGWDESTKFGDAVFGCHFRITNKDGTIEDICLRGLSILPAGGTSAAILEHIEKRILGYSRRLLEKWQEKHEQKIGKGSWAAAGMPSPENIGLHRLCEDTVLITDTCNGARCTKRMLMQAIMKVIEEKIGTEAWEAMSTEERNKKYKVFRCDCWQHLRNIIIDAMAHKADEIVKATPAVAECLELFSSFERVDVDGSSAIRACFKQFHHGGEYAKGRGREFEAWRKQTHKDTLFIRFERAMGSRQDLAFDGCIPLFWNRLVCLEFLRVYIDCPKSENKLDKALYTLLRCNEFTALLRVNTLWKYIFSEPFRWLAGKTAKLKEWSLVRMGEALTLVEKAMESIVAEPSRILDSELDIFAPVAEVLPEFKEWRDELFEIKVKAEDGTEYFLVREVMRKARTPAADSGEEQATAMTLELAKAQATRALEKMHDKRLALADKLESQGGHNSYAQNLDAHERLKGIDGTNDGSENKFATADVVMRSYRHISTLNASGMVQQRTAHDFDRPLAIVSDRRKRKATAVETPKAGFFWSGLTVELRHSLVEMARHELSGALQQGREERRQHDEEKLQRREDSLQRQLHAAVDRYAEALELFDQWCMQGVKDAVELKEALKNYDVKKMSLSSQLAELRRQIEMRTRGCGWTEFETKWSFDKAESEATRDEWKRLLLEDILPYECTLRRQKKLPTEAAPPQTKRRSIKDLGTVDVDALRLEASSLFSIENLLEKAKAARERREAAGISDSVEAAQPRMAPAFDVNLVGKRLEILWPYRFGPDGKPLPKAEKIWASGTVKRVADGLTDTRSARAKKILPAGALLWAWEADPAYNEVAGEQWVILVPDRWNKQVQMAWRYDPCELALPGRAQQPPRAPRVAACRSDEEYLTDDEH